jgi:4-amino-4-deoxy-L-arabinose transferase-like glycosyltransferase
LQSLRPLLQRPGRTALAITGLGLILRLFGLGARPLWFDEVISAVYARQDWPDLLRLNTGDNHPPGYYLALKAWLTLFGREDWVIRLFSVGPGVAAIWLTWLIGRRIFPERAEIALTAAALMAVSPFQVYFSQEARNYSSLAFLVLLATFFWLRALETNRWRDWLGMGLAGVAGLFVNFTTAFYLLALGLFPFILWKEYGRKGVLPRIVLTGAATGLTSGLLLWPKLSNRLDTIKDNFWIPQPDLLIILRTFYSFIFGVLDPASFLAAFGLVVIILLVAGWQVSRGLFGPERPALALTGWLLLGPLLLLVLISLVFQPLYLDKALIACAPYFYLVLGWTVFRPRKRPGGWVLAGVPLVVAVLLGLWLLPDMYSGRLNPVYIARYDAPAVNRYLHQQAQPGDMVVNVTDIGWLPLVYYNENLSPAKFPLKEYPFPNVFPALLQQLNTRWVSQGELTGRTWLVFELNLPPDAISPEARPYTLTRDIPWMHSPDFQSQTLGKFQSRYKVTSAVVVDRLLLVEFNLS